jgi:hypothetical protein
MGRYLDILRQAEARRETSEISEKRCLTTNATTTFARLSRLFRILRELERRCPDHVSLVDWQQAIKDGRRFLGKWGEPAEALGWTARDLFGLHEVPQTPHASYRRLARYDCTGLIWLLRGAVVVNLTDSAATICDRMGAVTTYRRARKPALGPLGDSIGDFQ